MLGRRPIAAYGLRRCPGGYGNETELAWRQFNSYENVAPATRIATAFSAASRQNRRDPTQHDLSAQRVSRIRGNAVRSGR